MRDIKDVKINECWKKIKTLREGVERERSRDIIRETSRDNEF